MKMRLSHVFASHAVQIAYVIVSYRKRQRKRPILASCQLLEAEKD